VTIDCGIGLGAVTALDGEGDGILANGVTAGPFAGFSSTFDGPLSGQTGPAVIPIPAGAWLFRSGLVGFLGVARRRKR